MSGFLKKYTEYTRRNVNRILMRPINNVSRKILRATNPKKYIKKVIKDIQKRVINLFKKKENSKDDYIRFGNTYYSKKLVVFLSILAVAIPILIHVYGIPYLSGKLWQATIPINSNRLVEFNGKAKLTDESKAIIYEGQITDGRINGYGKLYDKFGNLIYEGEFYDEEYSGKGQKYDKEGNLIYDGEFKKNMYSGHGALYDIENGEIRYEGMFVNGKMEGKGFEYKNGAVIYSGEFRDGKYGGQGIEYDKDGIVVYKGLFEKGKYDGEGVLFKKDGGISYDGSFESGEYEGYGTLYDIKTSKLAYVGDFKDGKYDGEGKLFDKDGKRLIYEGELKQGKYNGDGKLYNNKGRIVYNGPFIDGNIDYKYFANEPVEDLRAAFGEEDEYIMYEETFEIIYKDMNVIFTCSYADEDNEAMVLEFRQIKN